VVTFFFFFDDKFTPIIRKGDVTCPHRYLYQKIRKSFVGSFIFYELRRPTHRDWIYSFCPMQFLLRFSLTSIYPSFARPLPLSFLLFTTRSIGVFLSAVLSPNSRRLLRHRPRSMNICIIYFVSDSSGSSWQPAIFDTARSIDLTASAKTRCKCLLDSLHYQEDIQSLHSVRNATL